MLLLEVVESYKQQAALVIGSSIFCLNIVITITSSSSSSREHTAHVYNTAVPRRQATGMNECGQTNGRLMSSLFLLLFFVGDVVCFVWLL